MLGVLARAWSDTKQHLNFFRVHVLCFTFVPLFFSLIFYAANGQNHIPFIDALFNCYSAAVVCGLASIDLSALTGFQQALLFVQSCIGNPVIVSWVMVYIRRHHFAKKFEHIVEAEIAKGKAHFEADSGRVSFGRRFSRAFSLRENLTSDTNRDSDKHRVDKKGEKKRQGFFAKKAFRTLRPDMIRRMDDAPKPVGPNGWISEEPVVVPPSRPRSASITVGELAHAKDLSNTNSSSQADTASDTDVNVSSSNVPGAPIIARSPTVQTGYARTNVPLGHTLTVEFRTPDRDVRGRRSSRDRRASIIETSVSRRSGSPAGSRRLSSMADVVHDDGAFVPPGGVPLMRRQTTQQTHRSHRGTVHSQSTKNKGYGGFPYPTVLLLRLFKKLFPGVERRLVRTVTLPVTRSLSTMQGTTAGGSRGVPYISFDAIVGRNSKFHMLTQEQLEELGGVEYRALTALLWIVALYFFVLQIVAFIIIAPYMSIPRWRSAFEPPNLHRYVPPAWFSAFQVVSSFTNSGMSLVDQSMVPFQQAYPMIFVMAVLILAGYTAFIRQPIFLRFVIWGTTKVIPADSRLNETLQFLLDHPRRCFIYLFPSHQTWFLLAVVIMLTFTDWFFFLVLDIGNSTLEAIPIGIRVGMGFLQATAVRAAGFVSVSLSSLAPAVQVLYLMMMYVSVYPIALSVRSTNVYEEKSLGIFEDDTSEDLENGSNADESRTAVWGRYLNRHARRQLAFDMWWICLALFLLCIIERTKIENAENYSWFTTFTILFELISAYGSVGLSLGVPYANYSFSGALTPLSKLIIIAVMIRGRHRGLPVAIDRAVMLPFEFKKDSDSREESDDEDGRNNEEGERLGSILEDGVVGNGNVHEMKPISESPASATPRSTPRHSYESQPHP